MIDSRQQNVVLLSVDSPFRMKLVKWVNGAMPSRLKRLGSQADYSLPYSPELNVTLYLHYPTSLRGMHSNKVHSIKVPFILINITAELQLSAPE